MWFCWIVIFFLVNSATEAENLRIPLYRQNHPKEIMLNGKYTDFLNQYGFSLDWLKPHHKNHTRTNDTISLHRFLDTEFYAKIVVGSPGKEFNVVLDTTWRHTWLMSTGCSWKNLGCWYHEKYDHFGSSTYRKNGSSFSSKTDGLNGHFSYDNFNVGHSNVVGQLFVEMTNVPYIHLFSKADGCIGLGFKTESENPFFYNILSQTKIKKPLFSIYLNRDKSSDNGGSIILGAIEKKHIHVTNKEYDPITYVPVDISNGWWQFKVDSISIKKGNETLVIDNNVQAIADTSSNTIVGPEEDVKKIMALVEATELFFGYYQVGCEKINKLPPITFVIGGRNFTLEGKNYVLEMSVESFTYCLCSFTASNETKIWQLGGAFLVKYYSIYDMENVKIGFVRAA